MSPSLTRVRFWPPGDRVIQTVLPPEETMAVSPVIGVGVIVGEGVSVGVGVAMVVGVEDAWGTSVLS
jgi:hypothetical protein